MNVLTREVVFITGLVGKYKLKCYRISAEGILTVNKGGGLLIAAKEDGDCHQTGELASPNWIIIWEFTRLYFGRYCNGFLVSVGDY